MRAKPTKPTTSSSDFPPEIAELLDRADAAAADRLQEMGAGTGGEAKAARRALHLLKQRGVEPSAAPTAVESPTPVAAAPVITARLTNVGGTATQLVLFEESDPFGGAPLFHFFLTSFAEGLEEVASRRIPRREVEGTLARLKRGEGGLVVEAPADYARYLVARAVETLDKAGGRLPKGYTDAMRRIEPAAQTYDRALAYDSDWAGTLAEDLSFSREPEKLFQSVFFRSWFLGMGAVAEWEEKYFAAVQSRFAVDQAQRETLGDKVIEEAADTLLNAAAMETLRRALEEQATVLYLAGHAEEARMALFQAQGIDSARAAHENEFLRFYIKRSIFVVMAYKAEMEPDNAEEPSEEPTPEPDAPIIERA